MASQSKYYNTGGGELFIAPIVNGVVGTEVAFGQTSNVSFSTTTETITNDNTESCTTYEDLKITSKVTGNMSIETVEISPDMLNRAFNGTKFTTSVTAGTDVTSSITASLGNPVASGKKYISNLVVKNDDDSVTYTEGTDYSYNGTKGTITAIDGGNISDGDTLNLTYDNAAYTEIRIEAFKNSNFEAKLRFASCASNGLSYEYTFHRVALQASGDFSLKSGTELLKLTFDGAILASELITDDNTSKLFKIEAVEKV